MTSWQLNQHADDYYESLKRIKMEDGSSISQRLKQQDNLYQKKKSRNRKEWCKTRKEQHDSITNKFARIKKMLNQRSAKSLTEVKSI